MPTFQGTCGCKEQKVTFVPGPGLPSPICKDCGQNVDWVEMIPKPKKDEEKK